MAAPIILGEQRLPASQEHGEYEKPKLVDEVEPHELARGGGAREQDQRSAWLLLERVDLLGEVVADTGGLLSTRGRLLVERQRSSAIR